MKNQASDSPIVVTNETTRAQVDAAFPIEQVTFAPGLRQIGLRNMASEALAMAAGLDPSRKPAAVAEAAAWRSLADALLAASERDADGHGRALSDLASFQDEAAHGPA
jgi:hypothetical protein